MFRLFKKNTCAALTEQLSAYLDGRLGAGERQEVEKHLASCEACPKELAQIRATVDILHSFPRALPRRSFTLSESQVMVPSPAGWWQPAFRSATAVAAVLLALVFVGDFLQAVPAGVSIQSSATVAPTAAASDQAAGAEKNKPRAAAPSAAQGAAPQAPSVLGTPAPLPFSNREGASSAPSVAPTPAPVPKPDTAAGAKSNESAGGSLPFRDAEAALLILVLALGTATVIHWRLTAK